MIISYNIASTVLPIPIPPSIISCTATKPKNKYNTVKKKVRGQ